MTHRGSMITCTLALQFACRPEASREDPSDGSTTVQSSESSSATNAATVADDTTTSASTTGASTAVTSADGDTSGTDDTVGPDVGGGATLGFPRLAGLLIGNPKNYHDPAYQAEIARLDLAVLGMYYGWSPDGITPAEAVAAIKAQNPDILLANYTIMTEVSHDFGNPTSQTLRDKLESELGPDGIGDWWAYDAAGQHTDWTGQDLYGAWDTNLTLLTTPDENGEHWPQWLAGADHERLVDGVGLDMWYCDNNFWRPRSTADWDRDGTNDDRDDPVVRDWYRDGQRAYYDRAKELAPDMLVMVNADNDLSGEVHPPDVDPFDQYRDVVHAALIEHAMGASWSVETYAGWEPAYAWYRELGENLLPPAIVVFDIEIADGARYQDMRYGLATTLMADGWFSASTDYHAIHWFDEFDLAGTGTTKWLGAAVDDPPQRPLPNGVWMRRFEHGLALVNPKGNGEQTVELGPGWHRISGAQAPDVNDGSPATRVTLADRDGLLLVAD